MICNFAFSSLTLAQGIEKKYLAGYYLPMRDSLNLLPELGYIGINTDTNWSPVLGSYLLIDSDDADTSIECTMIEISLNGNELSFRTKDCFGNTYVFRGKFLRWGMMDFLAGEVLRGELSVYHKKVLVKKGIVGFEYEAGC